MIPAVEIRRAEAIVDRSGLVDELEDLLRPRDPDTGRSIGRPRDISVRTFLTGILLAAGHAKNLHLREVHRTLTRDILPHPTGPPRSPPPATHRPRWGVPTRAHLQPLLPHRLRTRDEGAA